jgi:hypothetical protein
MLGAGISLHPYYMVSEELRSGALEVVLPQYTPQQLDIYSVFSTRRNMPVRVRALLEFLKAWASHPPQWAMPQGGAEPGGDEQRSAHPQGGRRTKKLSRP